MMCFISLLPVLYSYTVNVPTVGGAAAVAIHIILWRMERVKKLATGFFVSFILF